MEEEPYAELYRREADGEKLGGSNQLEKSDEKIDGEKEKGEEWPEQTWLDVWSPEHGCVQTLQALKAKQPREGDDETPQDSKSPAPTKANVNPKEKLRRKACVGSAARMTIIKPTARKAKAENVAKAE